MSLVALKIAGVDPLPDRRPLEPDEQYAVEQGKKQWFAQPYTPGMPIPSLLASPGRQALLSGLIGGAAGAVGGAGLMKSYDKATLPMILAGAGAGGIGVGSLAAIVAGLRRSSINQGLLDFMKRTPAKTIRELQQPPKDLKSTLDALRANYSGNDLSSTLGLLKTSAVGTPLPAMPTTSVTLGPQYAGVKTDAGRRAAMYREMRADPAYQQAIASGPRAVIGPLVRERSPGEMSAVPAAAPRPTIPKPTNTLGPLEQSWADQKVVGGFGMNETLSGNSPKSQFQQQVMQAQRAVAPKPAYRPPATPMKTPQEMMARSGISPPTPSQMAPPTPRPEYRPPQAPPMMRANEMMARAGIPPSATQPPAAAPAAPISSGLPTGPRTVPQSTPEQRLQADRDSLQAAIAAKAPQDSELPQLANSGRSLAEAFAAQSPSSEDASAPTGGLVSTPPPMPRSIPQGMPARNSLQSAIEAGAPQQRELPQLANADRPLGEALAGSPAPTRRNRPRPAAGLVGTPPGPGAMTPQLAADRNSLQSAIVSQAPPGLNRPPTPPSRQLLADQASLQDEILAAANRPTRPRSPQFDQYVDTQTLSMSPDQLPGAGMPPRPSRQLLSDQASLQDAIRAAAPDPASLRQVQPSWRDQQLAADRNSLQAAIAANVPPGLNRPRTIAPPSRQLLADRQSLQDEINSFAQLQDDRDSLQQAIADQAPTPPAEGWVNAYRGLPEAEQEGLANALFATP